MLDNLGFMGSLFLAVLTAFPVTVVSTAFVDPVKAVLLAAVGYGLLLFFVANMSGFGID